MKKLTVFAYGSDADAIVRKLMDLKCVQIRHAEEGGSALSLDLRESDGVRVATEARLATVRTAIPALARYSRRKSTLKRRVHAVDRQRFVEEGRGEAAYAVAEKVIELTAELDRITVEQTRLDTAMQALLPWLDYDAPLSDGETAHTVCALGSSKSKLPPTEVLEAAGAYVETVSGEEGTWYLSVSYHVDDEDAIARAMADCGFVRASFEGVDGIPQSAYDALEQQRAALDSEVERINESVSELADALDDLEILYDIEDTTRNVCIQKQKLLRTQNCAILEGWIPEEKTEKVTQALSKFECACEIADPEEGEEPPVLLKNNGFASTFEWVIGMYSYPKYGTYDPTFIMSIFYFLIFGLMFADVGYGLVLMLACFGGVKLLNPREGMRRMLLMFGYCGISCVFMGVLFGGWFGDLPQAIINSFFPEVGRGDEVTALEAFFAGVINPIQSPTGFLLVALVMGEIHLIAGMVISMIQTWKSGERLEAICANVPYFILFTGLDMVACKAFANMFFPGQGSEALLVAFDKLSDVGLYVLIAGFASILLCKGLAQKSFMGWLMKGLGGLYALISFASDLLSYSRILALGLVAGVIGQVVNMMTGLGATGPIGFIFMLIVMILGHVLNIAINILGTFVHAARLQYIEFFGKFYEDGGKPFSPALPGETYSEDVKQESN
ncbi:MAG: V-type ATP synthase subunit I [Clostridia bacterium]|nr:V-type ATP synthase subunit I [Clostridia bacterium]